MMCVPQTRLTSQPPLPGLLGWCRAPLSTDWWHRSAFGLRQPHSVPPKSAASQRGEARRLREHVDATQGSTSCPDLITDGEACGWLVGWLYHGHHGARDDVLHQLAVEGLGGQVLVVLLHTHREGRKKSAIRGVSPFVWYVVHHPGPHSFSSSTSDNLSDPSFLHSFS